MQELLSLSMVLNRELFVPVQDQEMCVTVQDAESRIVCPRPGSKKKCVTVNCAERESFVPVHFPNK